MNGLKKLTQVLVLALFTAGCGNSSSPASVAPSSTTGALQVQVALAQARAAGPTVSAFRVVVFTPAPECRIVRDRTFPRAASGQQQLLTISDLAPATYTVRVELLEGTLVSSIYEEDVAVPAGQTVVLVDPNHLNSVRLTAVVQGQRNVPLKLRLVPVAGAARLGRSGGGPVGDFATTSSGSADLDVSPGSYQLQVNDTSQNYSYVLQSGSGTASPNSGSVIGGQSDTIQVLWPNETASRAFRPR